DPVLGLPTTFSQVFDVQLHRWVDSGTRKALEGKVLLTLTQSPAHGVEALKLATAGDKPLELRDRGGKRFLEVEQAEVTLDFQEGTVRANGRVNSFSFLPRENRPNTRNSPFQFVGDFVYFLREPNAEARARLRLDPHVPVREFLVGDVTVYLFGCEFQAL